MRQNLQSMVSEKALFQRTNMLYGKEKMKLISEQKVIIFGIGGVGSWCAESLVRSSIKHLTIVDSDRVCITNINRQLMATTKTIGQVKTEALKERLLEINPRANITAIQQIYNQDNSPQFELEKFDFIIDAIDSLSSKIHLINTASRLNAVFISSMGAALKIDPTRVQVGKFWDVSGCPLSALIRKRIRRGMRNGAPAPKNFLCVFSDEVLPNLDEKTSCGTSACICPKSTVCHSDNALDDHEWCSSKAVINGNTAHITAIFGFTLAGLVMKNLYERPLISNQNQSTLQINALNLTPKFK